MLDVLSKRARTRSPKQRRSTRACSRRPGGFETWAPFCSAVADVLSPIHKALLKPVLSEVQHGFQLQQRRQDMRGLKRGTAKSRASLLAKLASLHKTLQVCAKKTFRSTWLCGSACVMKPTGWGTRVGANTECTDVTLGVVSRRRRWRPCDRRE